MKETLFTRLTRDCGQLHTLSIFPAFNLLYTIRNNINIIKIFILTGGRVNNPFLLVLFAPVTGRTSLTRNSFTFGGGITGYVLVSGDNGNVGRMGRLERAFFWNKMDGTAEIPSTRRRIFRPS